MTPFGFAGDRGFDPLGLAKPTEYLQVDIDELDQNAAKNVAGSIVGEFSGRKEQVSAAESLQPYNEVCSCKCVGCKRAKLMDSHCQVRCSYSSPYIIADHNACVVCRCSVWTASGSVS